MFGTGGDEGPAVMTLREAFYNPKSYNCIGFENIWDDGIQSKECGFFIPQHTNLVYVMRLVNDCIWMRMVILFMTKQDSLF